MEAVGIYRSLGVEAVGIDGSRRYLSRKAGVRRGAWVLKMDGLTRDGTLEPVLHDQILRRGLGQGQMS